ncbi:MAG: TonB-dependent receptor [Bacteroidota bacterium]
MNRLFLKISMMSRSKFILWAFLFCTGILFSQNREKDTLDPEVIQVVKPYSPTVSDAFKIKKNPQIDSIEINKKKELTYQINSVPVASTFTPDKGRPKSIKREPKEFIYNNYVKVGYGNYLTPLAEVFAHYNLTKYSDLGGFIKFQSSEGEIDDAVLNDHYSDLNVDLFYKQSERYFDWKITGGFANNVVNWYGLSEDISFNNNVIKSIAEKQSYGTIYLGGNVEFFDALVHSGDIQITRFVDNHNSKENHLDFRGNVAFKVWNELEMNSYIFLELLNGKFENNFEHTEEIDYNFINVGFSPNFTFLREDLTINAGANLYYSFTNNDNDDSKFYVYPNVTASYKVFEESLIAYAGVIGDLHQNTYQKLAKENPFVSPTLNIKRSSQQYLAYAGAKGKWGANISFNAKVSYGSENDKALYKLNSSKTNGNNIVNEGYAAGNSFNVVYDDVQTIGAFGEVVYDFNENLKFGGNIEFNSYSLDTQNEAWNLPMLQATLLAKYKRKKWYAGADFYFASDRKDVLFILPTEEEFEITNSAYFDMNLSGGYFINDKWSAFVNLNNILSDNYQKYTHFKVQGFQFMAGATYKFDF